MKFHRPKVLSYREVVRFHGHNGPFLALGYKLGKYINTRHKPEGIMGICIKVRIKPEKPFTCIIDGLQCSTFATYGKGNIQIDPHQKKKIIVHVEQKKMSCAYYITEKAMSLCWGQDDLERAAKRIFRTPGRDLWHTKE
jgi:formylmethanofuran dehydrogenase subunit E